MSRRDDYADRDDFGWFHSVVALMLLTQYFGDYFRDE
jgi:hypothetical protein